VEEVIRVWGYDRIPTTVGRVSVALARDSDRGRQERTVRQVLVGAGLSECVTYAFSDPVRAGALGASSALKLLNPLSQDASALRAHPLEGLLGVIGTNLRRQAPAVCVFEICRTYERDVAGDTETAEPRWVALALGGARADAAWHTPAAAADVCDAKGLAELVLAEFGFRPETKTGGRLSGFEPDSHATLVVAGAALGEFGEVAASTREAFGIDTPVFAAVLPLDRGVPIARQTPRYAPLPRFPAVQRDMAFAMGERPVTAAAIAEAIRAEAGPPRRWRGCARRTIDCAATIAGSKTNASRCSRRSTRCCATSRSWICDGRASRKTSRGWGPVRGEPMTDQPRVEITLLGQTLS